MIRLARDERKLNRDGFSFIELIVVIVILGLLVGIVGPKVWSWMARGKDVTAKTQISQLETAIMGFTTDMGRFPTTGEGLNALVQNPDGSELWAGPYLKPAVVPKDPWQRDYIYLFPGNHGNEFDLYSVGPDGEEGTADDITNWGKR